VQALIIFVLLATNRLIEKRNKENSFIGEATPETEVRVIEKQVFVPMPAPEPPKPAPVVQPSVIEVIEKQNDELLKEMTTKKTKAKDMNEQSKCEDCKNEIGGSGVLTKGIVLCMSCYNKRRHKGK
jgi:hypothetical protein